MTDEKKDEQTPKPKPETRPGESGESAPAKPTENAMGPKPGVERRDGDAKETA